MVYHGIPCLHYGIAEELIQLKYTITNFSCYRFVVMRIIIIIIIIIIINEFI